MKKSADAPKIELKKDLLRTTAIKSGLKAGVKARTYSCDGVNIC
jgi:hypothetical protein